MNTPRMSTAPKIPQNKTRCCRTSVTRKYVNSTRRRTGVDQSDSSTTYRPG